MSTIKFRVNGKDVTLDVPDRTLLIHALRDNLRLTGPHVGCDTTQCGACTVHLDGRAVKACGVLAAQADGSEIVTIEGISSGDAMHPMQQAFHEHHGLQCGFCTPGMIMAGIDIARRHETLDEATVRRELEGNLCRCTGYHNIVASILAGAEKMTETAP